MRTSLRNAAPGTAPTLAPGTRYWITAENEAIPTVCHWSVTADGTFTGSGTLTTARADSTDSGANWADATNGNTHLLQVTGVSPFVVTNPTPAPARCARRWPMRTPSPARRFSTFRARSRSRNAP